MNKLLLVPLFGWLNGATAISKWTAVPMFGGVDICFDSSSCASNSVQLYLVELEEVDNSSSYGVVDFSNSIEYGFSDPVYTYEDVISYNTASFSAAFSTDLSSEPHALPAGPNEATVSCSVTHFTSGYRNYRVPVLDTMLATAGATQLTYSIADWGFKSRSNLLRLSFDIYTQFDHSFPWDAPTGQVFLVTYDLLRVFLGGGIYFDLPDLVFDASGSGHPVTVRCTTTKGVQSNYFRLEITFPAVSFLQYSFLISNDESNANAFVTPSPTKNNATNTTKTPTPTPVPTAVPTSGPTPVPTPYEKPVTQISFLEGGFEFCYASDCNIDDGVVTFTLDRLLQAPYITENGDVDGELLSDFGKPDGRLAFTTYLQPQYEYSGLLLMGVPYESGGARVLTEDAFIANASDLIRIGLEVQHLLAESRVDNALGSLYAPKGACRLTLGFFDVLQSSQLASQGAALTFTISAFHSSQSVTDLSVTRYEESNYSCVELGSDTGMYLVLPTYVMMGHQPMTTTISAKSYSTGDYAGLIMLTILLEKLNGTVIMESMLSSDHITDLATPTTTTRPEWTAPTTSADGRALPTKMLVLPNGQFGLCFDPTCDTSKAVKMGFTGLGSPQDTTTVLSRFANAPGFQFGPSQRIVNGSTEIFETSFYSLVPRSRIRPPMPYTAALAAMDPSTPAFGVSVSQYLTHGETQNGNQAISIPRGGLKFGLNITRWPFSSPSQTLVLNVTLGNITEGAAFTGASSFTHSPDSGNMSKVSFSGDQFLQIPLLAMIDGAMKAIQVGVSVDPNVGITFSLTFPAFASSLVYDPVMASQTLVAIDDANNSSSANTRVRQRGNGNSSMAISTGTAIAMLILLGLSVGAGVIRCVRHVPCSKVKPSKVHAHGL